MTRFFHNVFFLCRKELLAIIKDPASRFVLIMPVIIQTVVFGYAASYDLSRVPYAVLDQSRSTTSHELIARIENNHIFHREATLQTPNDIAPLIDNQKVLLVIHIGPRFEQQLRNGEQVPIQLILDARNSNTAGTAANYVGTIINAFNNDWRLRHGGTSSTINVVSRAWYNPNLETRWNLVPSLIATLSMLQTLLLTALSVAREREQGTFDQLLVTPLTSSHIMVGKAIPPVMIGLTQSTLVLLIAIFWFQIPFAGSLITLYTGVLIFTIACVGIGLSVSALSATMQKAMLFSFVLTMPMIQLSGLTTPIRNMPEFIQIITRANPLRYAIDFIQRVYLEGVGMDVVAYNIWPLILIAMVTLPTATWLFRSRLI